MSNKSKVSVSVINNNLCAGLQQYLKTKSLKLAGTTWTTTSIIAALQDENTLIASTATARSAWIAEVTALRAKAAANIQLRLALHTVVLMYFGAEPNTLGAFGYAMPKARKRNAETVIAAAQKMRATRVARHTMGRKQRAAIHGVVATPAPDTSSAIAEATTASAPTVTTQK